MDEIICEVCKKIVLREPQHIKRSKHHFCSYKCKYIYREKHPYKLPNMSYMHKIKGFAEMKEE